MSENLEVACELFIEAKEVLESTYEIYNPGEVLLKVKEAIALLEATHRPLLDAYNVDQAICKKLYCDLRD